jgi:hypothetical protein
VRRRGYGQVLQPFAIEVQNAGGMPMQAGLLHVMKAVAHAALARHITSQAHAEPQLT